LLRFKKIFAAIIAVQLIVLTIFVSTPAQAKSKVVAKPTLQMSTNAKTSYKPGDKVSFVVYSPNYKGKVEYRVMLTNAKTKKQVNLWNTYKTGYYNNNKGKFFLGNSKYTITYPLSGVQPGTYNLTVLVKRAGVKTSYDSYVRTQNFTVGPTAQLSSDYYESIGGKFKVKLPAQWEVEEIEDEVDGEPFNMTIAAPVGKDNPIFMAISTPTIEGDTLENEMSTLRDDLLGDMTGSQVKFIESVRRKVTVGTQEAYLVEYNLYTKVNGVNAVHREAALVTLNENMTNVVVMVTTFDEWNTNAAVYRQSLLSFIPIIEPVQEETEEANASTENTDNTDNSGSVNTSNNGDTNGETSTTPANNDASSENTTATEPVSNGIVDETTNPSSSNTDTSTEVQPNVDNSNTSVADLGNTDTNSNSNSAGATGTDAGTSAPELGNDSKVTEGNTI
jgi:hypothetical protein